ncbi:DUF1289 domain-containing protein [Vibrio salinus]|uniref:DUF1289 domain-containing protein n=1 Tax=Vibrio salinus TaxID=2899784 RepID=UPI001E51794B|nr:DUF1289 domain-containing protein [Vibrio salinus]MCE0495482.1 DUF1289 domain-containing protein [Vibrio salinus]
MNNVKSTDKEPRSPCIRHCCLDDNDVCIGCLRTLQEIIDWRSLTSEQKSQILIQCQNRRMQ